MPTTPETIFDKGAKGRRGVRLPEAETEWEPIENLIPDKLRRVDGLNLPEVSQPEVVKHYTQLSKKNYGVDDGMYPLGSCTMKYNPKINEDLARLEPFSQAHPLQPEDLSQGTLHIMYELGEFMKKIGGMAGVSLQPVAGAHGELTGLLLMKKYFQEKGEIDKRRKILLPDSSHGTNPATCGMLGFEAVEIKSDQRGMAKPEIFEEKMDIDVAGVMLTIPNTLGLFEEDILKVSEIVHQAGGLCYYDGANLNATLGIARPGDMGMDIAAYNLHKTFSTPHGGGGPGGGALTVVKDLTPYLPVPEVVKENSTYHLGYQRPKSIGKVHSFYGNFGVAIKAYIYIKMLGDEGLRDVAENAVLNANYLKEKLKQVYELPYDRLCKHEFVLSGKGLNQAIKTIDIAKRLIDLGFHPPTIYFPLIVDEALMIEPTETVSKEELDQFIQAMKQIAKEAKEKPQTLQQAPHTGPVRRLDEVKAAREPILRA